MMQLTLSKKLLLVFVFLFGDNILVGQPSFLLGGNTFSSLNKRQLLRMRLLRGLNPFGEISLVGGLGDGVLLGGRGNASRRVSEI